MKQIFLTRSGSGTLPKALKIRESGDLVPKKDELQIRVGVIGVNSADVHCRIGLLPCPPLPCVLGLEVSGVVSEIGPDANTSWKNKRVVAITKFNGYSDVVCVSEKNCLVIPDSVSFEQAASVPIAYLTAWLAIYKMGSVRTGDTVLIGNDQCEFALAAIDVAKHMGAKCLKVCSNANRQMLIDRGLDGFVDCKGNIKDEILEMTNGNGVDLIIEPPTASSLNECFEMLRVGGRIALPSPQPLANESSFLQKASSYFSKSGSITSDCLSTGSKTFFQFSILSFLDDARTMEYLKHILHGIEKGWVRPHIDKIFAFEDVVEAHHYVEDEFRGKVLLKIQ